MNILTDWLLYLSGRTRHSAALSIAQLQLRGQRAQGCPLLVLSPGSPPQSCLRVQLREDCTTPLQPPSAGRVAENHQDLPETFAPFMLTGGNEVT